MQLLPITHFFKTANDHGAKLTLIGMPNMKNHTIYILDLYLDNDKKSYNALGFKRFGFFGLFPAVLSKAARAAQARTKLLGMSGNMAGDGYQNGGALVVGKNGETLFHYVQEGAPDHASNLDLLKVHVVYTYNSVKFVLPKLGTILTLPVIWASLASGYVTTPFFVSNKCSLIRSWRNKCTIYLLPKGSRLSRLVGHKTGIWI